MTRKLKKYYHVKISNIFPILENLDEDDDDDVNINRAWEVFKKILQPQRLGCYEAGEE
jgi:hypothetical protein